MIELTDLVLGPDVEESALGVLRSGWLSQGPVVAQLEQEFACLVGTQHAVAVSSGTAALAGAMEAHGIGPGDEVLVPAFTFAATANAVLATGADVRFVDIRVDDFAIDPAALAAAIGPRTAAVVVVHLFGRPADMDVIAPIVAARGLVLVEDAAQAHGARVGGRAVGGVGTGCFSFYATKNLAAGEGGMVTTDEDGVEDRLRVLRNQGMRARYDYETVGHNWRLTDLAAAVVLPQLRRYKVQVDRRRAHAARLSALLAGVSAVSGGSGVGIVTLPASSRDRESVWHRYTVLAPDRDALAAHLRRRGIATGIHYPRVLPDHDCFRDHPRVHTEPTPVAEAVAARCLSLPVHAGLSDSDVESIADAVRALA